MLWAAPNIDCCGFAHETDSVVPSVITCVCVRVLCNTFEKKKLFLSWPRFQGEPAVPRGICYPPAGFAFSLFSLCVFFSSSFFSVLRKEAKKPFRGLCVLSALG